MGEVGRPGVAAESADFLPGFCTDRRKKNEAPSPVEVNGGHKLFSGASALGEFLE